MGVKHRCEIKRHPATTTAECPLCNERGDWMSVLIFLLMSPIILMCVLTRGKSLFW